MQTFSKVTCLFAVHLIRLLTECYQCKSYRIEVLHLVHQMLKTPGKYKSFTQFRKEFLSYVEIIRAVPVLFSIERGVWDRYSLHFLVSYGIQFNVI